MDLEPERNHIRCKLSAVDKFNSLLDCRLAIEPASASTLDPRRNVGGKQRVCKGLLNKAFLSSFRLTVWIYE